MTSNSEAVLAVAGAGKRFRTKWAIRDLSLSLARGSVTALIGPNGAGKSTLMRAITGLQPLTEGTVHVNGELVGAAMPTDVAYLAQDKPLYRQLDVATTLKVGRALNTRWDSSLAARLVNEAGLDPKAKVRTLSGGQRTRLALTLALARRPELLLLDEPLADLDPLARVEVQQTLLAEVADTGMTVLLSSHILTEVEGACSDLALIGGGRVQLFAPIDELVERHQLLTGPAGEVPSWLSAEEIVEVRSAPRQLTVLVDGWSGALPAEWTSVQPTLEEIVVARLRHGTRTQAA